PAGPPSPGCSATRRSDRRPDGPCRGGAGRARDAGTAGRAQSAAGAAAVPSASVEPAAAATGAFSPVAARAAVAAVVSWVVPPAATSMNQESTNASSRQAAYLPPLPPCPAPKIGRASG